MILIYTLTFVALSVWIDWQHLRDNDYIESHVSRWLLRALFVVGISSNYIEIIGATLLFTALFDTLLNKCFNKDLFYLGRVALWDIFWSKIPFLYICFKIVSLFVGVYLLLL